MLMQEYFLGDPKPVYPMPPNGFRPSKIAALANCKLARDCDEDHC